MADGKADLRGDDWWARLTRTITKPLSDPDRLAAMLRQRHDATSHAEMLALLDRLSGDPQAMASTRDTYLRMAPRPRNPDHCCVGPQPGQRHLARVLVAADPSAAIALATANGLVEAAAGAVALGARLPAGASLTPAFRRRVETLALEDLGRLVDAWYAAGARWAFDAATINLFLVDPQRDLLIDDAAQTCLRRLADDPSVNQQTRATAWAIHVVAGHGEPLPGEMPPLPEGQHGEIAAMIAIEAARGDPDQAVRLLAAAGALA